MSTVDDDYGYVDDTEPETIECLACDDTGYIVAEFTDARIPCPDCVRGWEYER